MSDATDKATRGRIYRADVLKVITESPGMIVYRDDIAKELNLEPEQIAGTVARLRSENNPIADEIEVAVPGRAWRYVPNARVRSAARAISKDAHGSKKTTKKTNKPPLTESLRTYFRANPGRVIYIDELQEAMSTANDPLETAQVRVGVANARQNHPTFHAELDTISSGRAWRYTPIAQLDPNTQSQHETVVEVKHHVTTPSELTADDVPASNTQDTSSIDDSDLMLLEKVGKLNDGSLLVRDTEKQMYRLSRM